MSGWRTQWYTVCCDASERAYLFHYAQSYLGRSVSHTLLMPRSRRGRPDFRHPSQTRASWRAFSKFTTRTVLNSFLPSSFHVLRHAWHVCVYSLFRPLQIASCLARKGSWVCLGEDLLNVLASQYLQLLQTHIVME